jgi:hypothetical protein
MPTAMYYPPKGSGSFQASQGEGKPLLVFEALKEIPVDDAMAERLKTHKHFLIDGKPAAFYGMLARPSGAPNGGKPLVEDTRPRMPVKGFSKKEDAIAFAEAHFGLKFTESMALKTMNDKLSAEWQKKFGDAAVDSASAAATAADVFMDTSGQTPNRAVDI